MNTCVVGGCHNSTDTSWPLLSWPRDDAVGRQWEAFVATTRFRWKRSDYAAPSICSGHFKVDQFMNYNEWVNGYASRLRKLNTAVPTEREADPELFVALRKRTVIATSEQESQSDRVKTFSARMPPTRKMTRAVAKLMVHRMINDQNLEIQRTRSSFEVQDLEQGAAKTELDMAVPKIPQFSTPSDKHRKSCKRKMAEVDSVTQSKMAKEEPQLPEEPLHSTTPECSLTSTSKQDLKIGRYLPKWKLYKEREEKATDEEFAGFLLSIYEHVVCGMMDKTPTKENEENLYPQHQVNDARIPNVVEAYNKLKASVKDQSLPAVKDEPTDGGCTSSRCVKDEPSDTEEQGEDHLMKNADVNGSCAIEQAEDAHLQTNANSAQVNSATKASDDTGIMPVASSDVAVNSTTKASHETGTLPVASLDTVVNSTTIASNESGTMAVPLSYTVVNSATEASDETGTMPVALSDTTNNAATVVNLGLMPIKNAPISLKRKANTMNSVENHATERKDEAEILRDTESAAVKRIAPIIRFKQVPMEDGSVNAHGKPILRFEQIPMEEDSVNANGNGTAPSSVLATEESDIVLVTKKTTVTVNKHMSMEGTSALNPVRKARTKPKKKVVAATKTVKTKPMDHACSTLNGTTHVVNRVQSLIDLTVDDGRVCHIANVKSLSPSEFQQIEKEQTGKTADSLVDKQEKNDARYLVCPCKCCRKAFTTAEEFNNHKRSHNNLCCSCDYGHKKGAGNVLNPYESNAVLPSMVPARREGSFPQKIELKHRNIEVAQDTYKLNLENPVLENDVLPAATDEHPAEVTKDSCLPDKRYNFIVEGESINYVRVEEHDGLPTAKMYTIPKSGLCKIPGSDMYKIPINTIMTPDQEDRSPSTNGNAKTEHCLLSMTGTPKSSQSKTVEYPNIKDCSQSKTGNTNVENRSQPGNPKIEEHSQ